MTESPGASRAAAVRALLLRRHAGDVDLWLEHELARPAQSRDEFETAANRNRLAALRALDPSASLEEELTIRLESEQLVQGSLSFDAGSTLMKPLQESVASLVEQGEVELELVGVSSGSTVLHVRPVVLGESVDHEHTHVGSEPIDATAAEPTLRRLLDLLTAAENQADVRPWISAIEPLERLSSALDRFDASMDVTWSGVSGVTRSTRFGVRGRQYVHGLMDTEPRITETPVSGRVTELRESGVVKVKTGGSRKSPAYEVRMEPEQLLGMRLALGDTVHFLVRLVQQVDKLDRPRSVEVQFVERLSGYSHDESALGDESD